MQDDPLLETPLAKPLPFQTDKASQSPPPPPFSLSYESSDSDDYESRYSDDERSESGSETSESSSDMEDEAADLQSADLQHDGYLN